MSHWVFWGGASRVGSKHEHNQDAWMATGNNLTEGVLIVICDGVSSTEFGGEAAQIVAKKLTDACTSGALYHSIHVNKDQAENHLLQSLVPEENLFQQANEKRAEELNGADLQESIYPPPPSSSSKELGIQYLRHLGEQYQLVDLPAEMAASPHFMELSG